MSDLPTLPSMVPGGPTGAGAGASWPLAVGGADGGAAGTSGWEGIAAAGGCAVAASAWLLIAPTDVFLSQTKT